MSNMDLHTVQQLKWYASGFSIGRREGSQPCLFGVLGAIGSLILVAICIWQAVDDLHRRSSRIAEAAFWLCVSAVNAWWLLR